MTRPACGQGSATPQPAVEQHDCAPTYVPARAVWIPTLVIWLADGRFTRLEGEPCEAYAVALAANWRLRPALEEDA